MHNNRIIDTFITMNKHNSNAIKSFDDKKILLMNKNKY